MAICFKSAISIYERKRKDSDKRKVYGEHSDIL